MSKHIIMPNLPNMAWYSLLSQKYEVLTDEFIQRWLMQLYNDYLIDPEYLFVSKQGEQDVRLAVAAMPVMSYFVDVKKALDTAVVRYANYTTGRLSDVVTLPTLPENTLCLGNLYLHESEV